MVQLVNLLEKAHEKLFQDVLEGWFREKRKALGFADNETWEHGEMEN